MLQFRADFASSTVLYVPHVYIDFCRENILLTEKVNAIPIHNLSALKNSGISLQKLAENGVQLFFIQVFQHAMFHADMHPGYLLVDTSKPEKPKFITVDYAVVGTLSLANKHYLSAVFVAFLIVIIIKWRNYI